MDGSKRACGRQIAPESFDPATRSIADMVVLRVEGHLGVHDLAACRRLMDEALSAGPTDVVLDLRGVRCDEHAVAVLALMRRYASRRGVRLALSDPSGHVLRLLRRDHLDGLFPVVALT